MNLFRIPHTLLAHCVRVLHTTHVPHLQSAVRENQYYPRSLLWEDFFNRLWIIFLFIFLIHSLHNPHLHTIIPLKFLFISRKGEKSEFPYISFQAFPTYLV